VGLFAGLAWAKRSMLRAIPLTILAVGLLVFLGSDQTIGFLVWMAGCLLVIAHSAFPSLAKRWLIPYALISSATLVVCLLAARTGRLAALGTDLSVGVAFTLFLFAVLYVDFGTRSAHYHNAARFFAGFSYSLYVLHFPLLLFLRAWIVPSQRWQPDVPHLFYGATIGAAALSFAWLVSTFTENKTRVVRNWMRSVIPRFDGRSN
jgi:peptidoglycan/LPS O-acetylase OafA/YrhL